MKKTLRLGLSLGICLALAATDASVAQGQGNNKKETTENKSNADKQSAKTDEARERRRPGRKPTLREIAEQKMEEAQARQGNSQNRGKQNKADKENKGNNKHAEKENNGNAYGKNKGDLRGREFGQARAAAAQLTGEQKREYLQETITYGDDKARSARTRIARALEALEQDRRTRTITDAEYNERRMRIDRVEQAVRVLEEKVLAGKQLIITIE